MSDRRPCRNSESYLRCRISWWLADRMRGRKVLGRVSFRSGGYFLDGGKVDLDAIRAQASDVKMEIRIYDEDGA